MGNRFIISDTHWGDPKIIGMENRPFRSTLEMDEFMIEAWNAVVRRNDTVYHVGDIVKDIAAADRIMPRLNGHIIGIIGNHDKFQGHMLGKGYIQASLEARIFPDGGGFMMSHRPQNLYNMFHVSVSVHGHIHGNKLDKRHFPGAEHVNVCVEKIDYRPLAWEDLVPLVEAANEIAEPCYRIQAGLDLYQENEGLAPPPPSDDAFEP